MGKFVDKRLEELGGTRVVEAGVGDDDGKYGIQNMITLSDITTLTCQFISVWKKISLRGKINFGLRF